MTNKCKCGEKATIMFRDRNNQTTFLCEDCFMPSLRRIYPVPDTMPAYHLETRLIHVEHQLAEILRLLRKK